GAQDDGALAALYASADLLVFPSRTDTLGQVVLEAQACGLPVVVSNEGGPKEMIDDGRSGITVEGNDPARWAGVVESLLDDAARRRTMSLHAADRAKRWSLAQTFDAFFAAHLAACE